MPPEGAARVARRLAKRGYNADRGAITLLAGAADIDAALDSVIEETGGEGGKITAGEVQRALQAAPRPDPASLPETPSSGGADSTVNTETEPPTPIETTGSTATMAADDREVAVANDITGRSTGTGEYTDFVATFRDRFSRLSEMLQGRVTGRPASALENSTGGSEAAMVGMVAEISTTSGGHWIIDLEDTTGIYPCLVMNDRPVADLMDEILLDEVIAVSGRLSDGEDDDRGILFVDAIHFPDIPHTFTPRTADRPVRAALISDVHVGSQEFMTGAWERFARWLHTDEAERIEYLLIAGDMVEGIGVYPNQDEELEIIDIYEQYEAFAERLKAVPGEIEIVMIPGNHDAVRLAEPQPAFDETLREIMSVHDAKISGNPSVVTLEGVSILMYHGVSLDEVIAELPAEKASYDAPQRAMYRLLQKRHLAPQFGGRTRLAPESEDYLVIDQVPDVFHTGHVHKLGYGKYRDVLAVNSGCWQEQTGFQRSVGIEPDHAYAPVVDLESLELTVYDFN